MGVVPHFIIIAITSIKLVQIPSYLQQMIIQYTSCCFLWKCGMVTSRGDISPLIHCPLNTELLFKLCTTTQYREGKHFLAFLWKSDIMATNNGTWRHFLYTSPLCRPKNGRFVHNFCLNGTIYFIFARPPGRWRHFMKSYIPVTNGKGVVPHFQVDGARRNVL